MSATKSLALGNRPSVATMVTKHIRNGKVKMATMAKLLGAPSNGGARRSTAVLKKRKATFRHKLARIQALRRIGVRTGLMARAVGTPAITYSAECVGLSDSHLEQGRSLIARASVYESGGKDIDSTLRIVDGPHGTADPAFDAHVQPIAKWALAWWQHWQTSKTLSSAFANATNKLDTCKASVWMKVTGPVTALLASAQRIGWLFEGPHTATDDLGNLFDFTLDSPAAITKAVKASVRRWRLAKIIARFPTAVPEVPDYVHPDLAYPTRTAISRLVPLGSSTPLGLSANY